jgi:DNA-directed RNA polymerase
VPDSGIAASTPPEALQQQREKREQRRAFERAVNQRTKLIAAGRESQTSYGAKLLQNYAEDFGISLDALLSDLLDNPAKAGPYFGFWPLLLHFADRGPRSIAAITLGVVIDKISTKPRRSYLSRDIGYALQDELKATRIFKQKGQLMLAQLKKQFPRKTIVGDKILAALMVDPSGWTMAERRGLGNLLLEVLAANTDLITFSGDRVPLVLPSAAAMALIAADPPRPLPVRTLPSLLPLEPWTDLTRGTKALVTSRAPMDLSHLTQQNLQVAMQVVNTVEQQQLVIDPWMVQLQRQAWDCDIPGLFSVRREPGSDWAPRAEAVKRTRIEEAIRQGEEVAGMPIWLKHDLDFRGRMYCCSRFAGHQGPDHQKALISFAQQEPAGTEGFDALLAAAAGHYGLGKQSWAERTQWGRAHLDMLDAIAHNPLDLVDAWVGADDPWQFLQAAKAISDFLADETTPLGCPVRYDQTASGMGIIGALTRDEQLCRHTNITGDRREDLYLHVGDVLLNALRMDLDSWDPVHQRLSEKWLQLGISRDLVKGPTMTTIYGAKNYGITEQLIAWLQEKNPDVKVEHWQREYHRPAKYLAHKIGAVIEAELKSCIALDEWLRGVSKRCMAKQQRIVWTSPMDFPLAFGVQLEEKQRTSTALYGSRKWKRRDVEVEPGELSARATNRGITANTIHVFDAALVHAVVLRCGMKGVPVLTNHDCFATIPSRARCLHRTLLDELRALYATDWLPEIRVVIGKNAKLRLPHPPRVGDLSQGLIGQNPYCFC